MSKVPAPVAIVLVIIAIALLFFSLKKSFHIGEPEQKFGMPSGKAMEEFQQRQENR